MKKKLLWIVPAALALLFLVGMGIYLDYTAGQTELPKVTLPGDQEPSTSPDEFTEDSTLPSSEVLMISRSPRVRILEKVTVAV